MAKSASIEDKDGDFEISASRLSRGVNRSQVRQIFRRVPDAGCEIKKDPSGIKHNILSEDKLHVVIKRCTTQNVVYHVPSPPQKEPKRSFLLNSV
ncbi:hypothetical protein C1H46_018776 [Malus baccata]|uniref:Uncharacterized protein n=1 Tax=Malus baccata TaxID=106549 RepID=A0A540MAC1_MALBA|nr:hypothetical protein C1H46_018776 [Malus baccata]